MNSKIGYIFICASILKQPRLWEEYFKNRDDCQILYLYYQNKPPVYNIKNVNYVNISKYRPGWGNINYVKTYLYALKLLLMDQTIDSMLLFSESCVPLAKADKVHNIIHQSPKSLLEINKHYKGEIHYSRVMQSLKAQFFIRNGYVYTYRAQGYAIKRDLAILITSLQDKYMKEFANVPSIDEHYITCVLQLENIPIEKYITSTHMMHFNWVKKCKDGKLPYIYPTLDKKTVDMISTKSYFLRKVNHNTNVVYLLNKLKN